LASAFCFLVASVAPVRGGTYFSLPRQRKVGKRKPLTPPTFVFHPRAPNGPVLHTATYFSMCVAISLNSRLTHFMLLRPGTQRRAAGAAQVANCVSVVAAYALHSGLKSKAVLSVR